MGAQGSKSPNDAEDKGADIVDYYQLLEISEDATADEIRRSFRRLALIHHPDKNQDNVAAANERFSAIQQAYEVLSDEQERAWYDSHKASLVPEPDAQTVFDDIKRGAPPSRARDRGLTVKHLERFFDPTIWSGFDDGQNSFFMIYGNLFARLQAEEAMVSDAELPSFGLSTWAWAPINKGDESPRGFYAAWTNFATAKDFSWCDQWNISEAPDRRVRRMMEKDNTKARDDARREYNDTVRSLAQFVRKRDPRYKAHLANQAKLAEQKQGSGTVTPNPAAQQKRQQLAEQYVEQDWQKIEDRGGLHADLEWAVAEGDDSEEWECVVCRKTFRSEAAWDSHERSKKHLKEVERLKWEMQQENETLGLEGEHESNGVDYRPHHGDEPAVDVILPAAVAMPPPVMENGQEQEGVPLKPKKKPSKPTQEGPSGPDVVALDGTDQASPLDDDPVTPKEKEGQETAEPTKREKRRARQARKAEAQGEQTQTPTSFRCNQCSESFGSRTKLFAHIKDEGHARAVLEDEGRPNRNSGKRGKRTKA